MSFLGKTNFCANSHAQLCQLCHVIQSDMLNIYHSLSFFLFVLLFQLCINSKNLSQLQKSAVPLQFPLPDVVIARDATLNH